VCDVSESGHAGCNHTPEPNNGVRCIFSSLLCYTSRAPERCIRSCKPLTEIHSKHIQVYKRQSISSHAPRSRRISLLVLISFQNIYTLNAEVQRLHCRNHLFVELDIRAPRHRSRGLENYLPSDFKD
jgi:hypothetical protein